MKWVKQLRPAFSMLQYVAAKEHFFHQIYNSLRISLKCLFRDIKTMMIGISKTHIFCLALTHQKIKNWLLHTVGEEKSTVPVVHVGSLKTMNQPMNFAVFIFSPPFGVAWSSENFCSVNRSDFCKALKVGVEVAGFFSKVSSSFVGSVYQLGPWSEWEDPVWGRFGRGWTPIELNLEHITVQYCTTYFE